jgi:hypothetical protein
MATNKITLNELRSLVKQIIKESDLGDVYSAYSNANEPEYPSKIENIISQAESDGLFEYLGELKRKKDEVSTMLSQLLDPIFEDFLGLASKLKSNGMITDKSDAEKFIRILLANNFNSLLSDGNKEYISKRFINKF